MNKKRTVLSSFVERSQCGSMLVELLLSIALAMLVIPFIFDYHQTAVVQAENVAIAKQMSDIQTVLERYIIENRENLLRTVGKNITRINIDDLYDYGLSPMVLENADKYQLRILKSADTTGSATLQGVVVYTDSDITPIRTREIVNMGGGNIGFVDGAHVYGAFSAWRNDVADMGINASDGIVGTTSVQRDNALYLWRIPSEDPTDATMMSAFNLGGHNIENTTFFNASSGQFAETLTSKTAAAHDLIFQNRTSIDSIYTSLNATVAGGMSADGRTMEVANSFTLNDIGKFSSFATGDLWVTNLTLSGLSIDPYDQNYKEQAAVLKINQSLDMTSGRIESMYTTVGFAGSITPRLVVYNKIEDSRNSNYYWDAASSEANFSDASFAELARLATLATHFEGVSGTESNAVFGAVSANKNATVADYMNAIDEIQKRVRAKYRLLNLE